ncbi:BnaC04g19710D [Brassica napus]|uniref:BnaC04g19710D protein n=2 Tax=Brassica TaxID=3705 RepID=A0A078F6D2_BRANA|nr:BnaC04g19710D [Brassica napus]
MIPTSQSHPQENLLFVAQENLKVWFWIQRLVPTSNGRPEQKLVKDGFIIRKPTKIHCPEEIPRVKED